MCCPAYGKRTEHHLARPYPNRFIGKYPSNPPPIISIRPIARDGKPTKGMNSRKVYIGMANEILTRCIACNQKISLGASPRKWQIITCHNCGSELEIIQLKPPVLDWPLDVYDEDDDDYYEIPQLLARKDQLPH